MLRGTFRTSQALWWLCSIRRYSFMEGIWFSNLPPPKDNEKTWWLHSFSPIKIYRLVLINCVDKHQLIWTRVSIVLKFQTEYALVKHVTWSQMLYLRSYQKTILEWNTGPSIETLKFPKIERKIWCPNKHGRSRRGPGGSAAPPVSGNLGLNIWANRLWIRVIFVSYLSKYMVKTA